MRLSLRQLQIFLAVAESGSTAAAASRVALSQSAASAALLELERRYDKPLFDRAGNLELPCGGDGDVFAALDIEQAGSLDVNRLGDCGASQCAAKSGGKSEAP